ncbi:UDP-N-acetylmuramate--L-alanine ligase [Austwickia chelonae]|uniref:UDP-N-acetylmuramate--L-alanine ligase n=1 Tax=Austwickia chelonae NBRC 105200 TaxID=1184607 RepID=K6W3T6_9MICO|nr:UDP-N-acetylmuramate--L-alanine ligase [Austwickia chelonae]GAB76477.1 UDP-N-acetylmuramate--L-alanine ligase [Austwickia chelonae NBRC 105200]SEW25389.1 UDP-N-acetylmuramate--L-alanine ligase [Austwickia chelonae]
MDAPVPSPEELGRVHVLAVGGAGMSAVARLLLASGVQVSGSDARDSEVLRGLSGEGVRTFVGHDPAHVADADTVVISSAIREDNVELVEARARGVRVLHRSQALASVMSGHRSVAVAGANGKTTTSSMLATALSHAGVDPSYAIGGELVATGTNAALGGGDLFVAEADESDGSFLVYHPEVAVVTNIQPDHLDFYGTFSQVKEAYLAFGRTVPHGGTLVACADDPGSAEFAVRMTDGRARMVTYGEAEGAEVRIEGVSFDGLESSATLVHEGRRHALHLSVPGRHNVANAAAAFAAAHIGMGVPAEAVLRGLSAFRGARRRFEVKGESAGVRVVDDYAHNPGKVAAVVETAARIARPGRLVVVFQPHLYSRTRDFAREFGRALSGADLVVVTDVYGAREDPIPGVDGRTIVAEIDRGSAVRVEYIEQLAQVPGYVVSVVRPGDLVVTVGAGDVTTAGPRILQLLAGQKSDEHSAR